MERVELEQENFGEVVVVLSNPFREMVAQRNSAEMEQSGHTPRSGPEIKHGKSSAK